MRLWGCNPHAVQRLHGLSRCIRQHASCCCTHRDWLARERQAGGPILNDRWTGPLAHSRRRWRRRRGRRWRARFGGRGKRRRRMGAGRRRFWARWFRTRRRRRFGAGWQRRRRRRRRRRAGWFRTRWRWRGRVWRRRFGAGWRRRRCRRRRGRAVGRRRAVLVRLSQAQRKSRTVGAEVGRDHDEIVLVGLD